MDFSGIADSQAESGVVATLVYHPEFILHSEFLKAGYFYDESAACIYWAIQELYKSGVENIDAFNISSMIASNKGVLRLTEKYNLPSMQEYIDLCGVIARHSLEEYLLFVDRVVTLSFKRDLYKLLISYQKECQGDITLGELSTKVYDGLNNLTEKYITSNNVKQMGEVVDDLWEQICKRRNHDGVYGIESKFPAVNEYFTYEPTELVLLKARMKKGKSAFMMNEAIDKIKKGIPTIYFDTEMSDRLFFERMLANLTGIEVKNIKNGNYTEEDGVLIEKAMTWIKKQPFIHIYDPSFTNENIYSTCKIQKYKINLQFVIYDYIKSNTTDSSSQYNELGAKCDFLKNNVAGDLQLAVLAAAQLNRNNQVADSDKLERYCSVSMQWRDKTSDEYLKDGENCGNYALTIQLNRLGGQMSDDEYIDLSFDGDRMRIKQADQHKVENKSPF